MKDGPEEGRNSTCSKKRTIFLILPPVLVVDPEDFTKADEDFIAVFGDVFLRVEKADRPIFKGGNEVIDIYWPILSSELKEGLPGGEDESIPADKSLRSSSRNRMGTGSSSSKT